MLLALWWQVALAALGRANLGAAQALLLEGLTANTARLRSYCELVAASGAQAAAAAGASSSAMAALHEQSEVLVRCAGYLLADAPDQGETPEPPPEAAAAALAAPAPAAPAALGTEAAAMAAASHPVALLFDGVGSLLRLQLTAITSYEAPPHASPLADALSPLTATGEAAAKTSRPHHAPSSSFGRRHHTLHLPPGPSC